MSPGQAERNSPGIVLTAEHASNRFPARYGTLGVRWSHIAWDEGSKELARALGKALQAPVIEGRWSRMLIDLNRSLHHPKVIPAVSFGVRVRGNENLTADERRRRADKYYTPFRESVRAALEDAIARRGRCLHLGVHTFVPKLDGEVRNADIGLLYDPARRWERNVAARIAPVLADAGFRVRRNYPYRGSADGHTTALRRDLSDRRYAGIEIEVNQALLGKWSSVTTRIAAAFAKVL